MSSSKQRIFGVIAATLVVSSLTAVVLVGAITAAGTTNDGNTGNDANLPQGVKEVDFKGCGEVWIILDSESVAPLDASIKVRDDDGTERFIDVTINKDDLERAPGQTDEPDDRVYKFSVEEPGETVNADDDGVETDKIIAVTVGGSNLIENPNKCADG